MPNKKDIAWENCGYCGCNEKGCNPKIHRLCGICGNQKNKSIFDRMIMYGSYGDKNSKYGWNIDHKTPITKGGTDDASNLRGAHINCNNRRGNN